MTIRMLLATASLSFLSAVAIPSLAGGAEPAGVAFDQTGPISVSLTRPSANSDPNEIRFAITNGSTTAGALRLYLTPASLPSGEQRLPVDQLAPVSSGGIAACRVQEAHSATAEAYLLATITSPVGSVCGFTLSLDADHGAGMYTGTLIVTGPDGSADELPVAITIAAAASPAPSFDPAKPVLAKPLPDPVTLSADIHPHIGANPSA